MFEFLTKNLDKLLDAVEPKQVQEIVQQIAFQQPATTTTDIFDAIEGYDDLKKLILLRVLESQKTAAAMLAGPPGTAKSLFLLEVINNMKDAYYFNGATTSGKGLLYFLRNRPNAKIICIDEVEKLTKREQTVLYDLVETGKATNTVKNQDNCFTVEYKNLKILAAANSTEKLTKAFKSRFLILTLPPYSYEEYVKIAIRLLASRYKLHPRLCEIVASTLWNKFESRDVRMLLHVGSLIKQSDTEQDIFDIILTLKKYHKAEGVDYN